GHLQAASPAPLIAPKPAPSPSSAAGQSKPAGSSTGPAPTSKERSKVERNLPAPTPKRWSVSYLVRMLPRRYLLKQCAAEFFFLDGLNVFFAFTNGRVKDVLLR